MLDPENDWVKKRKTRRAIGRRTVLSKILEIVKLIEGASTLP